MLILHGCWVPSGDKLKVGHFFVWGERPSSYYTGKKRGRPSMKVPAYPFTASERNILDVVGGMTDKKLLRLGYLVPKKNTMLLPSKPGYPPVSPHLFGVLDKSSAMDNGKNGTGTGWPA